MLIDPPLSFAEMAAGADVVEAEGVRLPIAGIRHLLRWLEETRQFLDRFLTPERKALMARFRAGEL